jgi:hypothetical protein
VFWINSHISSVKYKLKHDFSLLMVCDLSPWLCWLNEAELLVNDLLLVQFADLPCFTILACS